jgi:hypothetical protein
MTTTIVDHIGKESAMDGGETTKTGFVRVNPRDLADGDLDELLVGPIDEDGLSDGFTIVWTTLAGHPVARIGSFADAWSGMLSCVHLLKALPIMATDLGAGNVGHPTIDDVVAALKGAGCVDLSRPPRFPRQGEAA